MKTLFLILQIACLVFVATGILIEFKYQASLGFVFITAGSFAFAASEKIDKYRIKRDIYRNKLTNKKGYE